MALNPKTAVASRNSCLDAFTASLGSSPKMRWYDGTQPTDADTALGAQVMLVDLACSATFAAAASAGSATVNAITGNNAAASGTVTWGSFLTSANVRKHDLSIGTATSNLIVNSATIGSGAACAVSSYSFTMAA